MQRGAGGMQSTAGHGKLASRCEGTGHRRPARAAGMFHRIQAITPVKSPPGRGTRNPKPCRNTGALWSINAQGGNEGAGFRGDVRRQKVWFQDF